MQKKKENSWKIACKTANKQASQWSIAKKIHKLQYLGDRLFEIVGGEEKMNET